MFGDVGSFFTLIVGARNALGDVLLSETVREGGDRRGSRGCKSGEALLCGEDRGWRGVEVALLMVGSELVEGTRPLRSGLLRRCAAAAEVIVIVEREAEDDIVGVGAQEATRVVMVDFQE